MKNKRVPNLPLDMFYKVMKMVPMITTEVIIKNSSGIILTKRKDKPFKGYWHVPGGFIGYWSSFEDNVKRVAKEETGFKVKIKKFLGVYNYMKNDTRGHVVSLWYLVEPTTKNINTDNEMKFFNKAPKKTLPFQKKILKKLKLIKS